MGRSKQAVFVCSNMKCRRVITVPTSAAGKRVRCKICGETQRVPTVRRTEEGKHG